MNTSPRKPSLTMAALIPLALLTAALVTSGVTDFFPNSFAASASNRGIKTAATILNNNAVDDSFWFTGNNSRFAINIANWLATGPTAAPTPTPTAQNGKIVFTSRRDGNGEIYVMNADGTNQQRLTTNPENDNYPAFSADGSRIVFSRADTTDVNNATQDLYVINADGTNEQRLTFNETAAIFPTFSPDGSRIAFRAQRNGNTDIYVINADGTNEQRLTTNPAGESDPVFSPDGTKLAFSTDRNGGGNNDIYLINADGTGEQQLTAGQENFRPSFSPDGTKIAYQGSRNFIGTDIYVINADGTAEQRLTTSPESDTNPSWGGVATSPPPTPTPPPASAGQLIISEFRLRGPNGAGDEFVEVYNNTDAPHTVRTVDGSAGYAVAAQDGGTRCIIPANVTTIPARGHFLCANSSGYSLTAYPAGHSTTATADATYTTDIPDNHGLALFNTANEASFSLATRIDAVGPTTSPVLYREGTGYPDISTSIATDHSWVRRLPGVCTGSMPGFVNHNCTDPATVQGTSPPTSGVPQDTDNNASDFIFVDAAGTATPANNQRLGAPGPENTTSPIFRPLPSGLIDPAAATSAIPNRVRTGSGNSGTIEIRRKFTNNTGADITRLRFRVVDISTFPPGSGIADIRPASSTPPATFTVTITGGGQITVVNTTLEEPPSQPLGGGFNSTFSAGTVTLPNPLPAVDDPATSTIKENEIDVNFRFNVFQGGKFRVYVIVEALPPASTGSPASGHARRGR